jgi:polysaccharide deacetylase family protein (PEP-CTERM system associated)
VSTDGASRPGQSIVNALSVDVEDYFQVSAFDRIVSRDRWKTFDSRVVANTQRLLDLFDETAVKATFFTLGWVAGHHPRLVREIASRGHEVASHGYHHQLVYMLTPEQFREDVRSAKRALEDAVGAPVIGFRAPSFSIVERSLWALDVLIETGYVYDTSIFPIHHDRYGIPDAPRHVHRIDRPSGSIIEMPASTVRLGSFNIPIAGGGYFRQFPYAFTKWGIRRVNTVDHAPVVFYLHPWEVDPDQPRMNVGAATRWRHYRGLDQVAQRTRRLVRDFQFGTVAGVLGLSDALTQPDPASWAPLAAPAAVNG